MHANDPAARHEPLLPPHTQMHSGPWRVVAASERGTSHEKRGQPCQDAHFWMHLADGMLVAAVADGAGSAPLGEVGAAIAVRHAVEALGQHPSVSCGPANDADWQRVMLDAFTTARTAIATEAATLDVMVQDLATTLILVVATPDLIAAAHVGDGAAVVCTRTGDCLLLTAPHSGECLNETLFLSSHDALAQVNIMVRYESPLHVALLSDGLQMLACAIPAGEPHLPFFTPLFRFVTKGLPIAEAQEQLAAFLRSPRVTARTDDDMTLLLATLVR